MAVACSTRVRINHGRTPVRADVLADRLPAFAWQRHSAGAGAKGPRFDDWAWIHTGTGVHRHLLIRRNRTTSELAAHPLESRSTRSSGLGADGSGRLMPRIEEVHAESGTPMEPVGSPGRSAQGRRSGPLHRSSRRRRADWGPFLLAKYVDGDKSSPRHTGLTRGWLLPGGRSSPEAPPVRPRPGTVDLPGKNTLAALRISFARLNLALSSRICISSSCSVVVNPSSRSPRSTSAWRTQPRGTRVRACGFGRLRSPGACRSWGRAG